jgi:hypothetical protein
MRGAIVLGLVVLAAAGCQGFPAAASIVAYDQAPATSNSVEIERVATPTPAWIVIYASRDGAAGEILGSAHVPAGTSVGVRVDLGGLSDVLVVKLQADGPQPGPPILVDGKEVATRFTVSRTFRPHM